MITSVFVCGDYLPNQCGVVHYTERLLHALTSFDIASTVLTTRRSTAAEHDERIIGVTKNWGAPALLSLTRVIHHLKPDVVHIQFAPGSYRFKRAITMLPLALRSSRYRGAIVTTLHEYGGWAWQAGGLDTLKRLAGDHLQRLGWWDEEAFFLTPLSDALILTNADPEPLLLSRVPRAAGRIRHIPIGINIDRVPCGREEARAVLERRTGWGEDMEVLAFFGFLHPIKGLETLLQAFAKISEQGPNARLLLIGGWECLALDRAEAIGYIHSLQSLAGDLGVLDRIHFSGHIEDAEASILLSGSDIGVLPFNHGASLKSGSLLTLLAHGLPLVTTAHEYSVSKIDSLVKLVPPRDSEALASAVASLLADRSCRSRLSRAGQTYARSYSWTPIAQDHAELYEHARPLSSR